MGWPGIEHSAQFLDAYSPPLYVLDRILLQRCLYSLTGPTGTGKTAITMRLGAHVALGRAFGDIPVMQGRVLYLAGENPMDVQMRWAALAQSMPFDPRTIPVWFVPGSFELAPYRDRVYQTAEAVGGFSLVIVDTAITYFPGDNENDNKQMQDYGELLRSFCHMDGHPTVIVNSHPSKNRANVTLPRGGGAFLNQVDGNLTCLRDGEGLVRLHWAEKFRGPPFDPVRCELTQHEGPLMDREGRLLPTIVAKPLCADEAAGLTAAAAEEEEQLLQHLPMCPGMSYRGLAELLHWSDGGNRPHPFRVQRVMRRLAARGIVQFNRKGKWELTPDA